MYHYSGKPFQRIFRIKELMYIFKYMVHNYKDRLLKFTGHMQKANYEVYSKAIDSWIVKFDILLGKASKNFSPAPIIVL